MSALESLCLIAENTVSGGFPECEVSPVTTITLTSFHPQTTGTIQKPAERSFSQESFSSSPVVHSIQKVCVQRACMRLPHFLLSRLAFSRLPSSVTRTVILPSGHFLEDK